jgi:hypothetical protein
VFRRWTELQSTLGQLVRAHDQLDRRTEKMETILMIREPSSTAAADAYEGLRKQVVGAVSERLSHLSQLVQMDHAIALGADHEVLAKMVASWCEQASLERITDVNHPQADTLFELVDDAGGELMLLEPAYADRLTGRLIRQGRARRLPESPPPPVPAATETDHRDEEQPRHAAHEGRLQ